MKYGAKGGCMANARQLQILVAVPAAILASQLSWAADCSGRVNNVSLSSDTIEVDKGHTVTYFVAYSVTTSENSVNNAAGKCGGYFITTPDGKTRGVGVCARKLKDGSSFSDEWVIEPGAERGSWKMSGGTGALAGKHWSGWWQPTSDDGKIFMGTWGGNCD